MKDQILTTRTNHLEHGSFMKFRRIQKISSHGKVAEH
jgi:hypothetical protein